MQWQTCCHKIFLWEYSAYVASLLKFFYLTACLAQLVVAMYFASVIESATIVCFFEDHDIVPAPR